jgi:Fe2+ or Zn2+ uptake regulation protein
MEFQPAEGLAALRRAGVRVTAARLGVLGTLADLPPHADTATIIAAARTRLGTVSTQAVYDVLDVLTAAGLVRRIEPAGHPALYELRAGDNHHHVVCRACGAISDVDCVTGSAPCLDPSSADGFVIDEAEITFWGLCPECVAATSVSSGELRRTRSA